MHDFFVSGWSQLLFWTVLFPGLIWFGRKQIAAEWREHYTFRKPRPPMRTAQLPAEIRAILLDVSRN